MSWDIYLEKNSVVVEVDCHTEGGTYVLGGTSEGVLNVTYNYRNQYHFGLLHGERAGDTIESLRDAVNRLGTDRDKNYWAPTPGNAGYACSILLKWARSHPSAVWRVS
jgi:hypothetical protein